jgi:hypothetical protein
MRNPCADLPEGTTLRAFVQAPAVSGWRPSVLRLEWLG